VLPVAEHWFATAPVEDGLTLITEPHLHPYIQSNAWLVRGRDRDLLVDTGNGVGELRSDLAPLLGNREVVAVVTHAHADHMGGLYEFDERLCHRAEASDVEDPPDLSLLDTETFSPGEQQAVVESGYGELPRFLLDALPDPAFEPPGFAMRATTPTHVLEEGDVVDLGDRAFEVLHVPGHTPGSIALWEPSTGTLFSGDTVYADEPLLDELEGSSIPDYVESLRRLRSLPVRVVHGGHDRSFDRTRLVEMIDVYLARRATSSRPPPRSNPTHR
jgi:glyoxylase-like metal-dependent hydrolase (beta-lactamase superfamily II)